LGAFTRPHIRTVTSLRPSQISKKNENKTVMMSSCHVNQCREKEMERPTPNDISVDLWVESSIAQPSIYCMWLVRRNEGHLYSHLTLYQPPANCIVHPQYDSVIFFLVGGRRRSWKGKGTNWAATRLVGLFVSNYPRRLAQLKILYRYRFSATSRIFSLNFDLDNGTRIYSFGMGGAIPSGNLSRCPFTCVNLCTY